MKLSTLSTEARRMIRPTDWCFRRVLTLPKRVVPDRDSIRVRGREIRDLEVGPLESVDATGNRPDASPLRAPRFVDTLHQEPQRLGELAVLAPDVAPQKTGAAVGLHPPLDL